MLARVEVDVPSGQLDEAPPVLGYVLHGRQLTLLKRKLREEGGSSGEELAAERLVLPLERAKRSFFELADEVHLLTMNCLNGYFHFPYFDSLAEKLLKSEGRGAVAAFSPTGLSQSAAAQRYHKAILKEIFSGAHARLGDAVAAAQAAYLESGDSAELLAIYHLLGDPALSLR